MYRWQDYLATQLPVLWQPNADCQLTEVAGSLKGSAAEPDPQYQSGELVLRQVAARCPRSATLWRQAGN
jgi:hypothetical protein